MFSLAKSVKETNQKLLDKLSEMEKTIRALEKRISKLEANCEQKNGW